MTKQQAAQFLSQILSNIKATAQEHQAMQNALNVLVMPSCEEKKVEAK